MQGKLYSLHAEWDGDRMRWMWDAMADDEIIGSGIEDTREIAIGQIAAALELTPAAMNRMSYRCDKSAA